MHFKEIILDLVNKNKTVNLFIDMDGVIASYDFGKPYNFDVKRPLVSNINKLRDISKIQGVNMYILSVCREDRQIIEKNNWLDKYASFFTENNRFILSKESILDNSSSIIKTNFLKNFEYSGVLVLVDDDNLVLKTVYQNVDNIILFQDSELVD